MKKSVIPTTHPKTTYLETTMENGSQKLVMHYQRMIDRGEDNTHDKSNDYQTIKRKLVRYMTNGRVALTNFEETVVNKIYDISPGGVSFISKK